jgi:beta-glucuronidase
MAEARDPAGLDMTRRQAFGAVGAAVAVTGMAAESAQAADTPLRAPLPAPEGPTRLYPHESLTRATRDISGLWRFRLDPQDKGEAARWYDGLTETRSIPVPCSWNDLFDDARNYFGAAWYETEFHLDPAWKGQRIHLRFGSAVYRAKVWVNGQPMGEHVGGHLPFAFDLGEAARFDGPNRLTVMVENKLELDRVPAIPDPATSRFYLEDFPQTAYDFFPYSGLHRPVLLFTTPAAHIHDVSVVTSRSGGAGVVEVSFTVTGGWSGAATLSITDGAQPIRVPVQVSGGRGAGTIRIPSARLWGPEDPFLYTLTVSLGDAARPADDYALKIGVRTIEVSGDKLLLNGKPVHLTGFGKHEDFILHGRGQDLAVLVRDYELLKWIGANSFRTSHYPYSEEAMMLADEYGFLVIGETPGVSLTFSDRPDVIAARHTQLTADLTDLIDRDKNHPCVILWSIANESLTKPFHTLDEAPADAVAKGIPFFRDMFAHVRSLDRTRPVAMVSVQGGPPEWVGQGDVICANSYTGWYAVSGRLGDAEAALHKEVEELHRRHGAKPIIFTEFGADAVAGSHAQPAEMWTEEYQAEMIAMYLRVLGQYPFVVGTHPWAFADFRTAQSIMRVGALNQKGVFTRDRRPKLAAHKLREVWAGKKVGEA